MGIVQRLQHALRLRFGKQVKTPPATTAASYRGHVPPSPMPSPPPWRRYTAAPSAPRPLTPAEVVGMYSPSSVSIAESATTSTVLPFAAPAASEFRSGDGGDFGGAGASSSWSDAPSPAPAAPAAPEPSPAPSSDSGWSSSSDSSSSSSSSDSGSSSSSD
jgi:hypothetical protein